MMAELIDVWRRADPPREQQETGFFTDTTLCIGCKACEVACKQWNQLPSDGFRFTGFSYDNTAALSDTTWRHVAFVEQFERPGLPERMLMMSDVCKHCEQAPCLEACPTGSLVYNEFGNVYVQQDICNGWPDRRFAEKGAAPIGGLARARRDGRLPLRRQTVGRV
jgi:formate dehydrogenase iron-sulfur subunit